MLRVLVDTEAPKLTKEELSLAKKELIHSFPKVTRGLKNDPPISGQSIVNVSFYPLETPEHGVYGFLRIRGVWPDEELAKKSAEKIIKEHDSTSVIFNAPVGTLIPFTTDTRFAADVDDVEVENIHNEYEKKLREKIIQQNIEKEKKFARELEERKKTALEEGCQDDDPTSLSFYTKKRVARMQVKEYIKEYFERIESMRKSEEKLAKEITELDEKFGDYKDRWLELYNEERKKMGYEPVSE